MMTQAYAATSLILIKGNTGSSGSRRVIDNLGGSVIWKVLALSEALIIITLVAILIMDRGKQNRFIPISRSFLLIDSRTGQTCFSGPKSFEPGQTEPHKLPNGVPYCVDLK